MTPETVLSTGQHALEITIVLILVMLVPALAVGLLVSMFQAATQINEMTLTFVPKILTVAVVLIIFMNWIIRIMMEFTTQLFQSIPSVAG